MISLNGLLRCLIVVVALAPAAMSQQVSSSSALLVLEVHFYAGEPPAYQRITKSPMQGAWYSRFHQIKPAGTNDLPVNAVDIKPVFTESGFASQFLCCLVSCMRNRNRSVSTRFTKGRRSR